VKKRWVETDTDCFVCGDVFYVRTSASQYLGVGREEPGQGPQLWQAYDGDLVKCRECGAMAWVSGDGEGDSYIAWDEQTPHNLRCAKRHDGKGCPAVKTRRPPPVKKNVETVRVPVGTTDFRSRWDGPRDGNVWTATPVSITGFGRTRLGAVAALRVIAAKSIREAQR